jgi:hypothetical protein
MPAYEKESEENLSNQSSVNTDNTGKNSVVNQIGFVDNTPEAAKAYQNELLFGGRTLGATPEAIINAMSLEEFKNNVSSGVIEIELVNFIGSGQAEKQKISSI